MNGESISSDTGEKQEKSGFESLMDEVGSFDAAKAKENVQQFKEEKEKEEQETREAEEKKREQLKKEYEEQRAARLAEAEQKKREHDLAWEKQREATDYPTEIFMAFVPRINEMIEKASENGDESIDLTKPVTIAYGPHLDYDRHSKASMLTGREIGQYHSKHSGREFRGSMIDGVLEQSPDRAEFDKEIMTMAEELMPQLAEAYEKRGFRVQLDKDGIMTSVAWGKEPEPEPQQPPKKSGFQGLRSFFSR